MAASDWHDGVSEALSSILGETVQSYRYMEMPVKRYVLTVLLPAGILFLCSLLAGVFLPYPLFVRLPVPLLGVLVLAAGLAYPKQLASRRRIEIENQFHLLITHMTILSTTNIDRMEVFRILSREEEYGELARKMGRIVQIVDTWNQSLDDACRRRAAVVPSDALADFLDRLAYTLGAGQSLSDFLLSEQDVMISQYTTVYESTLDNMEVMKDLYMSMILSMTFALVFAIVLPILTGTNPTLTVTAVLMMFAFVQLGFYFASGRCRPTTRSGNTPKSSVRAARDASSRVSSPVGYCLSCVSSSPPSACSVSDRSASIPSFCAIRFPNRCISRSH